MITGKMLVELGYKPGKWFAGAIATANARRLEGDALVEFLKTVCPPPPISPRKKGLKYHKNIMAENEEEAANLKSVFRTMDELMKTPTLVNGAVMPDACPTGEAGQIPVGGVVGAKNALHPAMHSADICCSVMMTNFGNVAPATVLDQAHAITHFGAGGRSDLFDLPKELEEKIKASFFLGDEKSISLAETHLGTQGDGNHFLYVGRSEKSGETIMVTHHGSRGFGARLYKKGMKIAQKFTRELSPKTRKGNAWLPFTEKEGRDYWEALQIVREWTKLNHTVLHQRTSEKVGGEPILQFWNEHNFVFKDEDIFYHAKGATPLADKFVPDSHEGLRLIPLNMSEPVLIVKGTATETNLGFAPHGAGRNISRSAHIRKHAGKTSEQVFEEETKGLDVRFYCGNIDISELPTAYKNADAVQQQMERFGLGEVVDRIMPYGCIMAGDWQQDAPWMKKKAQRQAKKKGG